MDGYADRLPEWLPTVYRERDEARPDGYPNARPLGRFLRVVGELADLLARDTAQRYRDLFIETCRPEFVALIGELVGAAPPHGGPAPAPGELPLGTALAARVDVANTIRFRRRKGTAAVLEELARAVAGRAALVVELRTRAAGPAQVSGRPFVDRRDPLAPDERTGDPDGPFTGCTADVRVPDFALRLDGPRDSTARTLEVRRPRSALTPGVYAPHAVALFICQWEVFPVGEVDVRPAPVRARAARKSRHTRRFRFHPFEIDAPLFARPAAGAPDTVAEESELPLPIRPERLRWNRERFYGAGSSFVVLVRNRVGEFVPLPVARLAVADLSRWGFRFPRRGVKGGPLAAVDPVSGRLLVSRRVRGDVRVAFHIGAPAPMGGGAYRRGVSEPPRADVYRVVARPRHAREAGSLGEALALYHADHTGAPGETAAAVIEITFPGPHPAVGPVRVPAGQELRIRAAERGAAFVRVESSGWELTGGAGTRLQLDGLLIAGESGVGVTGGFDELIVRHCTFAPGAGPRRSDRGRPSFRRGPCGLTLCLDADRVRVEIRRSVLGPVAVDRAARYAPLALSVVDSVLTPARPGCGVAVGGRGRGRARAVLSGRNLTALGAVRVVAVGQVENALFHGSLSVCRPQAGCVRFSYLRAGSAGPVHQYRPVPNDRTPRFESVRYGHPLFARLSAFGPSALAAGADDEGEVGAFHDLALGRRLHDRLDDFAPALTEIVVVPITPTFEPAAQE